MASFAELVAERRARIDAFNANPSDALNAFKDLDLSGFTDALERTPIVSKADALAALDLIRDEYCWAARIFRSSCAKPWKRTFATPSPTEGPRASAHRKRREGSSGGSRHRTQPGDEPRGSVSVRNGTPK